MPSFYPMHRCQKAISKAANACAQAEMETPDFMVALRAQLESAASESGSGKSGSNSTSAGANSSDIRCVLINALPCKVPSRL